VLGIVVSDYLVSHHRFVSSSVLPLLALLAELWWLKSPNFLLKE
jgi:hypothetical protein